MMQLGVYGLKKITIEKPKLTPKICPRCDISNAYDAKFCTRCGIALDITIANQIDEARRTTDTIMDTLMQDQEFRELLLKKIREYNLK
jgi:ribosomal protein L40E